MVQSRHPDIKPPDGCIGGRKKNASSQFHSKVTRASADPSHPVYPTQSQPDVSPRLQSRLGLL